MKLKILSCAFALLSVTAWALPEPTDNSTLLETEIKKNKDCATFLEKSVVDEDASAKLAELLPKIAELEKDGNKQADVKKMWEAALDELKAKKPNYEIVRDFARNTNSKDQTAAYRLFAKFTKLMDEAKAGSAATYAVKMLTYQDPASKKKKHFGGVIILKAKNTEVAKE